jgi:hypothetical protein
MPGRNQPRSSRGRSAIARKVINTNSTNGIMYQGTCVAHDGTKITPCHNFGGMTKGGAHPSATGFMRSQPYKITAPAKKKNYLFNMHYFRKPSIHSIDCKIGDCTGNNNDSGCIMSTTDGSFCCTDGESYNGKGCNDATKLCSIGDTEIELCKRKIKTCNGKDKTTFSLAPNGIFMDIYGRWAFNIQDPNAFPALTYNGRAIVNFMYMAKTLSENASQIGTIKPISFFQLSGGNMPIAGDNTTYPARAKSKTYTDIPQELYDYTGQKDTNIFNETDAPTSQFATYFYGSKLKPDLSNIADGIKKLPNQPTSIWKLSNPNPPDNISVIDYFTTYNNDTKITEDDFGLTPKDINLFDWSSDKTKLLEACNILSINWGSNQAYTVAPFNILLPIENINISPEYVPLSSYGASWILYDQLVNYKKQNESSVIRMGGFSNTTFALDPSSSDTQYPGPVNYLKYIQQDTLATYSSSAVFGEGSMEKAWLELGMEDSKVDQLIGFLNQIRDNGGNKNIKPYIAQYVIVGSYGIDTLFYSIQYIKYSIINMVRNCFAIEEYGQTAGFSVTDTWGDMCLSPDFGLFAQHLSVGGDAETSQEWSDLLGDWSDPKIVKRYPQLDGYENDPILKHLAEEICQEFADYNDKTKYFPCAKYYCSPNCDKCSTCIYTKSKEDCSPEGKGKWDCSSCQPRPKNMVNRSHYMKNLHDWIKLNWNSFSNFIDIKKGGLQSINCLIGFFLNTCGPHVNAGWDIGWVFNNTGSGTWAHNSYSANDFKYTGDTVLNYQGYINTTKKGNITDPTLFYLKNAVYGNIDYGSNEKVKVDSRPPIYDANKKY